MAADVADAKSADVAVAAVLRRFGRLDILVNNAAMRSYSAVAEASAEKWGAVIEVNLTGAAGYCRAAMPALRSSGRGSIINVSIPAMQSPAARAWGSTTPARRLVALTRTLAHEEAAHSIRANVICPGSTLTDYHLKRGENKNTRTRNSLLGRWASPEEIAFPILWLASGEASFITGTTLIVDGGLHIY